MFTKLSLIIFFMVGLSSEAQNYFDSDFRKVTYTHDNDPYIIYDFSSAYDSTSNVKTKYFGKNAYSQFLKLSKEKDIILATSASFSSSMVFKGIPVGICSENGKMLNKVPNKTMDAMVIVFKDSSKKGTFVVGDLDKQEVNFEPSNKFKHNYNPRDNILDTYSFFNVIEKESLSVFQTQLLYSYKKPEADSFIDLFYGNNDRNRRFLVVGKKNETIHNIIIDAPVNDYLMNSAKNTKTVLENDGFQVLYLMNLDTGCKDILHVFNGTYLENLRPNPKIRSGTIEHASNLLVYYKDK